MTLDEAIKHCKEKAEELREQAGFDTDSERYRMSEKEKADCLECAKEHEQLAEWLKDYKRLLGEKSYAMGYQDGLEDGLQDIREQGEWLKSEVGLFKCSICGRHICTNISNDNPYIDYPFCHCGAEMKGGAE